MIIDRLAQWRTYAGVAPLMAEAFRWLEAHGATAAPGKHPILGDRLIASVNEYRTRPLEELRLESHRDHIDIQCVVTGEETLLWAPTETLEVEIPHNPGKDVTFHRPSSASQAIRLLPGLFAIFLPADGHAPGGAVIEPLEVRKIVVKVPVA